MSIVNQGQHHDDTVLVSQLKACAKQKDLFQASILHADISKKGIARYNKYVGNTLVYLFAKCGALLKAQEVFDELPARDAVSWTALVTGYVQYGHGNKALSCYEQMQSEGFLPDGVTLACILKACGGIGAAEKGQRLHGGILHKGSLKKDVVLGNALIDMYAKCGLLLKAQQVFHELPSRDIVSWNALLTGYCQYGLSEEAFECFDQLKQDGLSPDEVSFSCFLKACGSLGAAEKGKYVHVEIIRKELLEHSIVLGNSLVDMYAKCGAFAKALQVFGDLAFHDVVSWSALITGYCQHGYGDDALQCFERMKCEGLSPDEVILACILKACGSIWAAEKGQEIHAGIIVQGFHGDVALLESALVDMYSKCGILKEAQQVFDKILVPTVVTWNALITGYCQHAHGKQALECFECMKGQGLSPDLVTLACILKACGSVGETCKGKELHAEIIKKGLSGNTVVLANALVDMYAKCGAMAKAKQVFDEIQCRNVVSWNALITGYCQHECGQEALECYKGMKCEGILPDILTFASILKACGIVGAAGKGKAIHAEIARSGYLSSNTMLGNALVDMYGKCGAIAKAEQTFDELLVRDVVSFNALIAAFCERGFSEDVIDCFGEMKCEGISPDGVTFACILKACSSMGAIEQGQVFFETMSSGYGIIPTLEHHACIVDLFGRAGYFKTAMTLLQKMPSFAYLPAWFSVLSTCYKWGNVKLGSFAFDHVVKLDGKSAVPYFFMSSMHATAGKQEHAAKVGNFRLQTEGWNIL